MVSISLKSMEQAKLDKLVENVKKLNGCTFAVLNGDSEIKALFKGKILPLTDLSDLFKGVDVIVRTDCDFTGTSMNLDTDTDCKSR